MNLTEMLATELDSPYRIGVKMKAYFALEAYGDCGHELIFLSRDKEQAMETFIGSYCHIANLDYADLALQHNAKMIEQIEEISSNTDKDQAWFMETDVP